MQKTIRQKKIFIPPFRSVAVCLYMFMMIILLFENLSFSQTSNYTSKKQERSDKKLNETGLIMLKMKKYYESEKLFSLAIIKNPSVSYYYNNLSVVYMNQCRYNEAYNNLLTAISIDPHNVKALSNMAITCFRMYRFFEAYSYYIKAIRADKKYTDNRFEKNKVIKKIEEIQSKNPDNKKLKIILYHLTDK